MRILVNELLRLWESGFVIPTEAHPTGRRIRVVLMCVCCDKPAAHKVGGFGGHSHTFFCTRCWITQADKGKPEAFQKGGFRERTDYDHREAGFRYTKLDSEAARDKFVKAEATRWTELARLPYFDVVRMIVIDPMHNLLLGVVKTHFYHIWVQTKILRKSDELPALHAFLKDFQMPAYLGRLPALVGEPAGGSLTADQWMVLATVVGPLAIPQIWEEYMGDPDVAKARREAHIRKRLDRKKLDSAARKAAAAAKAAAKELKEAEAKKGKKTKGTDKGKGKQTASTQPAASTSKQPMTAEGVAKAVAEAAAATAALAEENEDDIPCCLHPDDPANFLKLSLALRILLKREVNESEIDQAETLLQEYCTKLLTVSDSIVPSVTVLMMTIP